MDTRATERVEGCLHSGRARTLECFERRTTPAASRRLVTRIADSSLRRSVAPSLPFGGTWTFELSPNASGAILRITEDGEVYNPVYRFMSAYLFGHHATIETYLMDLGKKFNMTVSFVDASR